MYNFGKSGALFLVALVSCAMAGTVFAQPTGRKDYMDFCAACHGSDGKGGREGAGLLIGREPPDLTQLRKRNRGVFPFDKVESTIDGRSRVPSHERFDMPFWGVNFQTIGKEFTPQSEAEAKRRIDSITRYVESLQQ